MFQKILNTSHSKATVLIRLMVGIVFLSEGLQKFLFTARGVGRFETIGFPSPEFWASFVGTFEVLCGILILLGLVTRLASLPLITIMIVAISSTKIPILLDHGFWAMMHAARTDFSMLLGSLFLLIRGGGGWSVDRFILNKRASV
ncbi:MAG TPA: DoxX family protein [Sunxiuqinia sp.]|nr:DoxX family protein [Sunxiuqinia sp.]